MKFALTALSLICVLFTTASCGDQHSSETMVVTLDQGKKWDANPETTTGVNNMQKILADVQEGDLDISTRKALQEKLENEFQTIFKKCTMTGEAHNQLHNYLLPMRSIMKDIDSKDATIGNQSVTDMKSHVATYSTYFQ